MAASFSFQVRLLLRKNVLMLARNAGSTALQVGVGVLFLLLLFLINAGLNSNTRGSALFSDATDLPAVAVPRLKQCDPELAVGSPVALPGDTVGCFTLTAAFTSVSVLKKYRTTGCSCTPNRLARIAEHSHQAQPCHAPQRS